MSHAAPEHAHHDESASRGSASTSTRSTRGSHDGVRQHVEPIRGRPATSAPSLPIESPAPPGLRRRRRRLPTRQLRSRRVRASEPSAASVRRRDRSVAARRSAAAAMASAPPKAPAKPKKIDPKLPGSGIPARQVIRMLVWVRRVVAGRRSSRSSCTSSSRRPSAGRSPPRPTPRCACRYPVEGVPPRRSVRRGDDAPLDAHRLPRPPLVGRRCSRSRSSSAASSAAGSARSARCTTSSAGSSRRATGAATRASRRTRRTAYQRVKYYLMYAFLRGGRRRQRHRRALRSDLHRACAPSASACIPAVQYIGGRGARRRARRQRAPRAVRRRRRAGLSRAHGLAVASSSTSTRRGSSAFSSSRSSS